MLWTEAQEKQFLEKVYRRSHSEHSKRYYEFGINNFRKFCAGAAITTLSQREIYQVLDDYVSWLDKRGTRPKTIADCVSAVRKFLGFLEIEIESVKFRSKVTMPKITKIDDRPINIGDIRLVLARGKATPQMRALVFTLISSGMRIGEALSIHVSDLNLQAHPATIQIKPEYSKTRTARVAYVSDEAKEALGELVKKRAAQDFVFPYSGSLWVREKYANRAFRRMVARAGLNEMIDGHRIHKLHFHNFRKFFLTKGSDTIGEHAAHALCGHGFYMDTYYRKSEEERAADYLKLMPRITVFGDENVSMREVEVMTRKQILQFSGFSEQEIDELGDLSKYSIEDLKELDRKKESEKLGLNGHSTQKIVPWSEVRQAITDGWELVSKLEDTNEAIVRLPK